MKANIDGETGKYLSIPLLVHIFQHGESCCSGSHDYAMGGNKLTFWREI